MRITVITVSYNSDRTIVETLKSVKNQTYNNIEHIIIDGQSKDKTLEIVNSFEHVSKVISEKDNGIYDAMNKGIKNSTGQIIGILNSDDIFYDNEIIENIANEFNLNPEIQMIYGDIVFFKNSEGNIIRYWKTKPYFEGFFENGYSIPHPSMFVRSSVYKEVGMYEPNYQISSDIDFMIRALKTYSISSKYLPCVIVKMRYGGRSTKDLSNILLGNSEILNVFKKNNLKASRFFFLKKFYFKIRQFFITKNLNRPTI